MPSKSGIEVIVGGASRALAAKLETSSTDIPAYLSYVQEAGIKKIDSAIIYGASEEQLGTYEAAAKYGLVIDTKNPGPMVEGSSEKDQIIANGKASLQRLKVDQVDIFYLHTPDHNVPISSTLAGIQELYKSGMFRRFGLSNFLPSQVREVYSHCKEQGYVLPTVYQGNYNAFARHYETRGVPNPDSEALIPLLRELNISFYAYSPSAGGFLAKTAELFSSGNVTGGGRFDLSNPKAPGDLYNALYNKELMLQGLRKWNDVATQAEIKPLAMALRWVRYNSILSDEHGDAIIIGGRNVEQLRELVDMVGQGPLSDEIAAQIDGIWDLVKAEAPVDNYHDFIKGNLEKKKKEEAEKVQK